MQRLAFQECTLSPGYAGAEASGNFHHLVGLGLADGPTLLDQAAQRLSAQQDSADQDDPQRAALPWLLEQLSEQERRLIWHRYQRRLPLSPAQLRRVMGLDDQQLAALEQRALRTLRQAAQALQPRSSPARPPAAAAGRTPLNG